MPHITGVIEDASILIRNSGDNMGAKSIKKVLIDQGYTIAGLAKMVGLSREHLSRVINGHCESDCAKAKIAEVLGKATSDLWAQDEDTTPRH